jgi:hypothetical protein
MALMFLGACVGCQSLQNDGDKLSQDPDGNFVLYVSNQSKHIDPVQITVTIDGRQAVKDKFSFDNAWGRRPAHNWIKHQFQLAEGKHEIKAVSPVGDAVIEGSFELEDKHWAVINFWASTPSDTSDESKLKPRFTIDFFEDQPLFQ